MWVHVAIQTSAYCNLDYSEYSSSTVRSLVNHLTGIPNRVRDPTVFLTYPLRAPRELTSCTLSGCSGGGGKHVSPLSVTLTTTVPSRVYANLILSNDYSGIYNVTDASGNVLSRRYTGEPRFVALLLNETTWSNDGKC